MTVHPPTKRDRLAAAEALRWRAPLLRRLSGRMLRHLLRPWFDAGWSPADVLYALDHRPDGTPWRHTGTVRTPAAWLRHRLAVWLVDGRPQPSRSQRAAAAVQRPQVRREPVDDWRAHYDGRRVDPAASSAAAAARAAARAAAGRSCSRPRPHGA